MNKDKNLIDNYLSGDKKSLEILLENHLQSIFSACYRVCLDEQQANDICQNVVVKIIANLKKFKQKSSFKTWYFRIAYNESLQFLKKKNKMITIDSIEITIAEKNNVEKEIQKKEQEGLINEEINTLPMIERNIILYFYFDEMSIKSIANILHLNENTIKTKLARTRKLLHDKFLANEKINTRKL